MGLIPDTLAVLRFKISRQGRFSSIEIRAILFGSGVVRRNREKPTMNQVTSASPRAAAAVETNVEEVALFPIPDLVAFPGTAIPLHVFEPRYRKMVHDCVESGRKIGVCHTVKEIRPAKKQQSKEKR